VIPGGDWVWKQRRQGGQNKIEIDRNCRKERQMLLSEGRRLEMVSPLPLLPSSRNRGLLLPVYLFCFLVWGTQLQASHLPGRHSSTELNPQPLKEYSWKVKGTGANCISHGSWQRAQEMMCTSDP
jgi:hypothetical protein